MKIAKLAQNAKNCAEDFEMATNGIQKEDFLKNSLIVLHETFEGSPPGAPSAYLDRGIGVFPTLDRVDFEQASTDVAGSTIAAHTEHLKFYVDRLREFMEGRTEEVNWDQSWLIETVDSDEWNILREGIRKTYEDLLLRIAETEVWNQENIGDFIAIIAHSAYHLSAIRQISKSLSPGIHKTAE